jgi:mono/diheme cytochrome c family protein
MKDLEDFQGLLAQWLSSSKLRGLGIVFLGGSLLIGGACTKTPEPRQLPLGQNVGDQSVADSADGREAVASSDDLEAQVQGLLDEQCLSCHNDERADGGFGNVGDIRQLAENTDYVVPGDPEASILYRRMAPEGDMPPSGPVAKEQSDLVAEWILSLAPDQQLENDALAILDEQCAGCHNPDNAQGDFGYVMDVERMVDSGRFAVPGQPELSLIYSSLAPEGTMPPNGEVASEDRDLLAEWIISLAEDNREPLTDEQALALIREDVEQNVAQADRPFVRYFSLQEAYNRGFSTNKLETLRLSLAKVFNSLSRARDLVVPQPTGEEQRLLRVNLGEAAMDPQQFDAVLADFYPFGKRFVAVNNDDESAVVAANDQFLRQTLQSEQFLIRADWFVATAALPVLYERFLNLPATVGELEQQLGVDSLTNIQNDQVVRSGFKNSNVSSQNRIIERHRSSTTGLPYWVSYDFASNAGAQSIFNAPLGPVGIGFDAVAFDHDGGEYIFQLPNGLFGYYLSDSLGAELHRGPQEIVRQDNGPRQLLGNIVNGLSCMSCHGKGLLNAKDEIRGFAAMSATLTPAEKDKIFSLYPEPALFEQALNRDNQVYFAALNDLGIDPFQPEVVERGFGYYHQDLNRQDVQRELQISEAQLVNLLQQEPFKTRWVSLQQSGGLLSREEFNLFAPQALEQMRSRVDIILPLQGDYIPTPQCLAGTNLLMDNCVNPLSGP